MSVACVALATTQEFNKSSEKNAAKLLCCSIDISPDPSMALARLSDWGWQVNLSGDLLSSKWWHHDKAECHHFAVEIGREMADSWTSLHDAKAAPCPTTLPWFQQWGFVPLLYAQSRLLIGVHVFQICVRQCVKKNSFLRCQSFVLTTRESAFNTLGNIFLNTANAVAALRSFFSRWLLQFCQLNIICKVLLHNIFQSIDSFFWLFIKIDFFKQNISKYSNGFSVDSYWSLINITNDFFNLDSTGTI